MDTSDKGSGNILVTAYTGKDDAEGSKAISDSIRQAQQDGGTISVSAGSGEIDDKAPITASTHTERSELPAVMSTLRTAQGKTITNLADVDRKTSTVEIQGVRTKVIAALASGLLAEENGLFYDPTKVRPSDKEAWREYVQEEDTKSGIEDSPETVSTVSKSHQSELQGMEARIGGQRLYNHLARVSNAIANGTEASQVIGDMARDLGADETSLTAFLNEYVEQSVINSAAFLSESTGHKFDANQIVDEVMEKFAPKKRVAFLTAALHSDIRTLRRLINDLSLGNYR